MKDVIAFLFVCFVCGVILRFVSIIELVWTEEKAQELRAQNCFSTSHSSLLSMTSAPRDPTLLATMCTYITPYTERIKMIKINLKHLK